jgi:hypothetical protein
MALASQNVAMTFPSSISCNILPFCSSRSALPEARNDAVLDATGRRLIKQRANTGGCRGAVSFLMIAI